VLDGAGSVVGTKEYNAFGAMTSQTDEQEAVGYTGRVWNGFLRLQHSRARVYTVDPHV
jgi:hypothetical protein